MPALPTYENDLVICRTIFKHDAMVREAEITYALNDATANKSAQQWADWLHTETCNRFDQQVDTSARIMRTETLKGDGSDTFTTGISTGAPVRGTNAMSSAPPNCAILVKKNTGFGGRRNRGRFYLPFMLNEGEVDEAGNLSSGVQGDIDTLMGLWWTAVEGEDAHFTIANRTYDAAWDVHPRHLVSVELGETVTGFTTEPVIATQRRRMPRS